MNYLRMLLLFPVLIIQMSGIPTSFNWNSIPLAELSRRIGREIKKETLSVIPKSPKDYVIKRADLKCENSPIYRKENPLKCEIHPKIILKKCGSPSLKKDSADNQQTVKKAPVITNVLFNGTGNAKLF